MSMAGALRNHQQNWNRMQDNTYSGIEQRADESVMTDLRGQNLAMQKAGMDDATTRRGQNFGLVGDLSKPRATGLEGLSSLLDGIGSSGGVACNRRCRRGHRMGNTGMATAGARQVSGIPRSSKPAA
jgi:hypothetical protein